MKEKSQIEYCLIVGGDYEDESETLHALRDPFIEDWVERTGRFRVHHLDEMEITPGVKLSRLGVSMLEEGVFEIASTDAEHPLTERKARGVAEALKRQDMFEQVDVRPRNAGAEDVTA